MKEQIKNFIENNNIDLSGTGSDFNGQACILCGYALYIGMEDFSELNNILYELNTLISDIGSLEKLFTHAYNRNYKKWWGKESNRSKYKL